MTLSNKLPRTTNFHNFPYLFPCLILRSTWSPRLDVVPRLIKMFFFLEHYFSFLYSLDRLSFCRLIANATMHIFTSCRDVSEISIFTFEGSGPDPRNRIIFSLDVIFANLFVNKGSVIFEAKFH